MPDDTLCDDSNCPLRGGCYRYRAIPKDGWRRDSGFRHADGCRSFIPTAGHVDLLPVGNVDRMYNNQHKHDDTVLQVQ